ncbi:amidohydrolase family protein [Bordetella pseudohinzii]|uniref:Atrazine chlorohydrolase n=1 Tax=Bordetella pseudohinzii TaxID=1331258 RepID=A0A0J6F2U2_9BORD|nr:amidohydrolase family protein [Bordetella pseudohinzii]ANY14604.1 hypothetical protein BBN53_01085 [Bordetella pseudohinzii]KMM26795.1 hypothetical protein L540_12990 [Bordetella pseudohinzii]KXA75788.1 hypothetical protein AW877_18840 [Bordetella pseudohinzii]KXA81151.1 hypothetical protein AW878_06065 [Bordetella pseudohinzii]CUI61845.1 Atrazine chlorohydrolase [Bordetella pseudohinzii]
MPQTLITRAHLLSLDPAIGDLPQADILIEADRIARIAPRIDAPHARRIDAAGRLVLPGLINAHIHTWETALRGIGGNWAGLDYFNYFHGRLAPLYTPEDTYLGTLAGAFSQMDAGVTTIFDWCHNNSTPEHTDAAIQALQASGIRAVFGHGTIKPKPRPGERHFSEIPHPVAEIRRLRLGALSDDQARVTLAMAILGPDYATLEVCRQDFRAALDFDLLSSAHAWGRPNRLVPGGYRQLAAEGLLAGRHNVVHANYFEDDEVRLLIDHGASITATPGVEMQFHARRPLSGRVRAAGGLPSIGVDSEVGNKGDMFDLMRTTLLVERMYANQDAFAALAGQASAGAAVGTGGSPIKTTAVRTREVLEWATRGNAAALGMAERIGSLAPGKQADLIMIERSRPHILSTQDPVQAVVSYAQPNDVSLVMIAGEVVKEDGVLRHAGRLDTTALQASAQRLMRESGVPIV